MVRDLRRTDHPTMDLKAQSEDFGRRARAAARVLARTSAEQKNRGLRAMADELVAAAEPILVANGRDLENAAKNGLAKPMVERLTLNAKRLEGMAEGIRQVAA